MYIRYHLPILQIKISSSDISNIPLITRIAKKNKPIIMSVGAADLDEIVKSVNLIKSMNDEKLTLLHCVLEYPTPYEHANLKKIGALRETFPDAIIGYSDHTKPDEHMDVVKTAFEIPLEPLPAININSCKNLGVLNATSNTAIPIINGAEDKRSMSIFASII